MKLLAVETTTSACSVALRYGDSIIVRDEVLNKGHAERVLPIIGELLATAQLSVSDLDALVVDHGPGSFTGIRVGIGLVQGIAFTADLPVICVSSLALLAHRCGHTHCISALDARMQQVYWASYERGDNGVLSNVVEPQVSNPESVSVPGNDLLSATPGDHVVWHGVGTGFSVYAPVLDQLAGSNLTIVDAHALPDAKSALEMAEGAWLHQHYVSAERVMPLYVRNQVVQNKPS